MSLKSKAAAQFTIQDMKAQIFFWTFTFKEALSVVDALKRWREFLSHRTRGLVVCFPNMSGIRVFEMHPGNGSHGTEEKLSHGIHIHMLVNEWMDVDVVRKLWEMVGGGRLQADTVKKGEAGYVCKYLNKQRAECLKGVRLWAPVGYCDSHKVRDIVVDTRWTACYQFIASTLHGFSKLPWNERIYLVSRVLGGTNLETAIREGRGFQLDGWEMEWIEQERKRARHAEQDSQDPTRPF